MSREAKIVLAVCAVTAVLVAGGAERHAPQPQRQRPLDQTVVYARVQHGPGVTQYIPVAGSGANVAAPIYSDGELTQIRSFGKNGEQIIYTVSPGQEGRFLYTRSLGPNGTLVYEPASMNPKPKQVAVDSPADAAKPDAAVPQQRVNYFETPPAAPVVGGKPPAQAVAKVEIAESGRLAREWSEIFSSLTGSAANASEEAGAK